MGILSAFIKKIAQHKLNTVTGEYDPVKMYEMPYQNAVSRGLVNSGVSPFDKYGITKKLGASAVYAGDLWEHGGPYTGFLNTAEDLVIYSSSANDTAGGTGMQTGYVSNLMDGTLLLMPDKLITMNGLTDVDIPNGQYRRCFRSWAEDSGSIGTNDGTVYIVGKLSRTILATIEPGRGKTQMMVYTVPRGRSITLDNVDVGMSLEKGFAGSARLSFKSRKETKSWITERPITISNSEHKVFGKAMTIPELTDLVMSIDQISDNDTYITASALGELYSTTP